MYIFIICTNYSLAFIYTSYNFTEEQTTRGESSDISAEIEIALLSAEQRLNDLSVQLAQMESNEEATVHTRKKFANTKQR